MSIIRSATSFPQRLKEGTSYLHKELEGLPAFQLLLSENVSSIDYLTYLGLMFDVVSDIESVVFPILSTEVSELEDRKKTQLLELDFQTLAYSKRKKKPVFGDLKHKIPVGFAFGMLYVIEGSTLGGRVIYKHVNKTLGYSSENGAAYFAGYGDKTGQFWKKFMVELVAHEKSHDDSIEIIAGANYTFQAISRHFVANSGS